MAAGGVPRLTIKKLLNHADTDITAVYDRHSYDPEKRTALEWWDVKLTAILSRPAWRISRRSACSSSFCFGSGRSSGDRGVGRDFRPAKEHSFIRAPSGKY